MTDDVRIAQLPADFDRWQELLDLITSAFAYMDGVIDPPSSAKLLTVDSLKLKAQQEHCYIAQHQNRLVGCIFCADRQGRLYVGKLAIAKDWQGKSVGKALMQRAERLASQLGKPALELETRIELTGNQAAFSRLGFVETARKSHAGYDRPTSITMRKAL